MPLGVFTVFSPPSFEDTLSVCHIGPPSFAVHVLGFQSSTELTATVQRRMCDAHTQESSSPSITTRKATKKGKGSRTTVVRNGFLSSVCAALPFVCVYAEGGGLIKGNQKKQKLVFWFTDGS